MINWFAYIAIMFKCIHLLIKLVLYLCPCSLKVNTFSDLSLIRPVFTSPAFEVMLRSGRDFLRTLTRMNVFGAITPSQLLLGFNAMVETLKVSFCPSLQSLI